MKKDAEDSALDSIMEDQEKKEAEEMFNPASVQVIVNVGGHGEPDGDEPEEDEKKALKESLGEE